MLLARIISTKNQPSFPWCPVWTNEREVCSSAIYCRSTDDDNSLMDPQLVRLSRELETNRWFFPMLNDHRRNELYEQAIEMACQVVVQNHNKKRRTPQGGDGNNKNNENVIRVLDIGSGTGLLAILAAKHLQKLVSEEKSSSSSSSSVAPRIEVTSIEMSAPLATLARQTVADNGLSDVITVVEGHSTTYEYSSAAATTTPICAPRNCSKTVCWAKAGCRRCGMRGRAT